MLIGCCGLWLGFRRLLQGVTAGKIHKLFAFFIARSCPNVRELGQTRISSPVLLNASACRELVVGFPILSPQTFCLSSGLVSRLWADCRTTNK
jgi:hypothetical protein